MINESFLSKFGEAAPYRINYNKNYTGLAAVSYQNGSGFIQIKVPLQYYSIEKINFQYKAYDSGTPALVYVVTEAWCNIVPGANPVYNMYFAEETGDPLRMKKEFPIYSRQGMSPSQYYFNCVFDNTSTSIGWEFMMTFGAAFTGDLRVWIEISGQYFK